MSGFIIDISLKSKEFLPDLEKFAMRMAYEYRFNNVQKINKDQIRIVSINNPVDQNMLENDGWLIFFFGRLYPERDTKNLCEELLRNLNKESLEQAIENFSGSFDIFIWDKQSRKYYVITDQIGTIPVYVLQHKDEILISTEWKTFIGYNDFIPNLNQLSILNSLLFGRVKFTEETFCKQCKTFLPGSITSITSDGSISQKKYYQYRDISSTNLGGFEEAVDSGVNTISDLVNSHLDQYERPALFLSGGIDSRLLAAGISEKNKNKVLAVSFGMKGNDESFIADEVASAVNIKYIDFELTPSHFIDYANASIYISEGQDLFAQGYMLYVCDQLRRGWNADAILDGMEIGVSLGGDYLKDEFKLIDKSVLPQRLFDQFYIHKSPLEDVFLDDIKPVIKELIARTLQDISDIDSVYNKFDYIYIENYTREVMRLRHRIIRRSLPDIMIISDSRYLDLVSGISLDYKKTRRIELAMLKKLNPDLMSIRYQNTLMPLNIPAEFWEKGKTNLKTQESLSQEIWAKHKINIPYNHYYTNFSEWFRANKLMKDFICENLLASDCHLNKRFIQEKWLQKVLAEHFAGVQDHRASISYLMTIELFLRQFNF